MIHHFNIYIHVAAGTIALAVGVIILLRRKGTRFHRQAGQVFVRLLAIVTATGFIGWLFFRSNSFLLMLTLLAGYNTFSGYRVVKSKHRRPAPFDFVVASVTLVTGMVYLFYLMNADRNWSPSVIYPTLSGIVLVTSYDILKILVFHFKVSGWWVCEHIYKIISAFSALLSAFVGTILPDFKPYSQIGPSAFCLLLIIAFILQEISRASPKRRSALTNNPG